MLTLDLSARGFRTFLAAALGLLIGAPTAAAPLLYLVAADDDQLRVVDGADASTVSSVTISLAGEIIEGANGLARHSNGTLYALLKLDGQSNRELVTVNPNTGVATSIGDTGHKMAGLAFDATDTLYGVTGDQQFAANPKDPETLFTISLSDASTTLFQVLGNGDDGETIAYRPDDGLLYHASGTHLDQVFETIDLGTNAVTDIPLSGDPYTEAGALTYAGGGSFFMADRTDDDIAPGNLYSLGDDGVVSLIGALDVFQPKGLVLVPEPTSALLVGGGLLALAGWRRRAR